MASSLLNAVSTRRLRTFWSNLGRLPARKVTWTLAAAFSAWVLLDLLVLHWSSGLAHSTYDAMVRSRLVVAAPDPRILIVDIDEASLSRMAPQFGRWPWSRDALATVLDHVEKQQPAAVAWDILFSDADLLNPGGDAAFDAAVARSSHSLFPVVRLPTANDGASRINAGMLPGLWTRWQAPGPTATIALIPPFLDAIAKAPLGYNNAQVDDDGVIRRYRYLEPNVTGGRAAQSLALRVLQMLDPVGWKARVAQSGGPLAAQDELVAWRRSSAAYPRVSFADVFTQAEGGTPAAPVPSFAGKVVIVGATAPSLHDVHATPLSPVQAGVDSLATAIDNALNGRHIAELPQAAQAAIAIALCLAMAAWAQRYSVASLEPALLLLPAALLGVSYLSLNGSPVFIEMHAAAGLALTFLLVLRYWNYLHRTYWCSAPPAQRPLAIWSWFRSEPWVDAALDGMIDAVQRHAPQCRVLVLDASAPWPRKLRWPELARHAALIGPADQLTEARPRLEAALRRFGRPSGEPAAIPLYSGRDEFAAIALRHWAERNAQHSTTAGATR